MMFTVCMWYCVDPLRCMCRMHVSNAGLMQDEDGVFVLPKKDAKYEKAVLEGAGQVLDSAMTNPMFGTL